MTAVHQSASPQFARRASTYDAHATVQAEAAQWLSQWLPAESSGLTCLELGAGTGLFTQYLPHCFESVISTDISPEMLHICRSRVPNAEYRLQDAWDGNAGGGAKHSIGLRLRASCIGRPIRSQR